MTIQALKAQLVTMALALEQEYPQINPIEYFHAHFITLNDAIVYADQQGVKLAKQPINQFHTLCKSGKLESIPLGDKNIRIIVKESLDKWIESQKQKQGTA